jgi:hypothetical protein
MVNVPVPAAAGGSSNVTPTPPPMWGYPPLPPLLTQPRSGRSSAPPGMYYDPNIHRNLHGQGAYGVNVVKPQPKKPILPTRNNGTQLQPVTGAPKPAPKKAPPKPASNVNKATTKAPPVARKKKPSTAAPKKATTVAACAAPEAEAEADPEADDPDGEPG